MPDAHLVIGRVIPERKGFRHDCLTLNVNDPVLGITSCVVFRGEDGQLIAKVFGDTDHLSAFTLKSIVRQAEQTWLNAHAFIHGEPFEVDVVSIVKGIRDRADGSAEVHYQDNVDHIIEARGSQVSIHDIWALCESAYLRRALNDLRMALTYHDDGPFYCYRAIDSVRKGIGGKVNLTDDGEQWDRMWQILGGSRAEVDEFRKLATDLRHGEPVAFSGEEWRQAILNTWSIVEKYMLHLLRGRGRDPNVGA